MHHAYLPVANADSDLPVSQKECLLNGYNVSIFVMESRARFLLAGYIVHIKTSIITVNLKNKQHHSQSEKQATSQSI